MKKIKIFGLPFAGGSEYSFFEFKKTCPFEFEFIPVSLPGRGKRISEDRLEDLNELVEDIFTSIKSDLNDPYVIYGHSMGGVLSALLIEKIKRANLPLPITLFVSGCISPSRRLKKLDRHLLPDDEFIEMLFKMGGSPKEILENDSLLDLFLPILRSDFKAVDTYIFRDIDKLDVSIHVMIGTEEKITAEDCESWEEITNKKVYNYMFSGDHFFIFNHIDAILTLIKEKTLEETYV